MPIELDNGKARLSITPDLGGGLTGYDFWRKGEWLPIFRRVDPHTAHPFSLSSIVLAPFSGRVSGSGFSFNGIFHPVAPNMPTERYPIHGSAFSLAWTVIKHIRDHATLELAAVGPGPFRYDARLIYRLEGADLVMELQLVNRAARALPYGAGFHPWFVRDRDTRLKAAATHVWLERADHLPESIVPLHSHSDMDFNKTRNLPPRWVNNWFEGWDGRAQIDWPDRQLSVRVEASDNLDRYVVFSPAANADFFCFEPVSHPVDAFNLAEGPQAHGMKILSPGETLTVSSIIRPE